MIVFCLYSTGYNKNPRFAAKVKNQADKTGISSILIKKYLKSNNTPPSRRGNTANGSIQCHRNNIIIYSMKICHTHIAGKYIHFRTNKQKKLIISSILLLCEKTFDCVFHQTADCHWPDSSRHRSNYGSLWLNCIKINITAQFSCLRVTVDSHIHYDSPL